MTQRRLVPLSWLTLIFGMAGLFHWVPELLGTSVRIGDGYLWILLLDVFVGVLGILGSAGLRKQPPEAWPTIMFGWGALISMSVLIAIAAFPEFWSGAQRGVKSFDFWAFAPRMAFYAAVIAASPYALWMLFTEPREHRPEATILRAWLLSGAFAGGLAAALLISN